tara:strand:+ start:278 stop:481 length:204 start_codon:yes stop_codon:yes gene_type:complete
MTKAEFDSIDHSIIWLWKIEKEMRDLKKSYCNVWADWSYDDTYKYGRLEGLQEYMVDKGVKFIKGVK